MGMHSRLPGGQPESESPSWKPADPSGALIMAMAVRCCQCGEVVGLNHAQFVGKHAFCPDHKGGECKVSKEHSSDDHFNISQCRENNNITPEEETGR